MVYLAMDALASAIKIKFPYNELLWFIADALAKRYQLFTRFRTTNCYGLSKVYKNYLGGI